MTNARFIQIHTLTSFSAALLNRDDSGLAKRLPFGDAVRTRISSQCLKRHWRTADDAKWSLAAIGPEMAVRSRQFPEMRIRPDLAASPAASDAIRDAISDAFARLLYNPKEKKAPAIKDRQALLIGEPELAFISKKAREIASLATSANQAVQMVDEFFKRKERNNLQAMLNDRRGALQAGLEAALFGRMVTSDPDANTDAAIHVAHAFTVHAEQSETDYFTVVDDLETGTGAGGVFDTEVNAGLFYAYVVIDVPALVRNLGGDRPLAAKVVKHLLHLIATVSPGAKKGSTAPYAWAELMLVETGERQPRSLANAFRSAVKPTSTSAAAALRTHLSQMDAMYGAAETRRLAALDPTAELPGTSVPMPLAALADAVASDVAAEPAKVA
jgi:CRISPR system Cascade subunit CasC